MASSAAGEPSPPPTGGWLSGLVSGASRILAAVLGPEPSASDATSSSPESSQSPLPPRRALSTAGSLGMVSDMDPKDAAAQLLMQETFSRSECDALMKIIQERVVDSEPSVDEPDIVLPIAWHPCSEEHPVAYSSLSPKNSPSQTSGILAYSPLFDNTGENRGLKTRSTTFEDPCTLKDLSHDQHRHVVRRSSYKADTFEEPRRVKPKLNRLNIPGKLIDDLRCHEIFSDPSIHDVGEQREFPEEFKDIPLLGTDSLTLSSMASKGETARTVQHLATSSSQAHVKKRGSAKLYPFSNRDLTKTAPVKVEPFDESAPLEPEMMHLAQKNDERTLPNDSCSVSKMIFQEDIEAAPSASMGLQGENRSRNCTKGLKLQGSIPTKRRSPATSSRRPSHRRAIGSWNGQAQQSDPASVGQERNACHSQGKRPVGRSRSTEREVKATRRLQL